MIRHHLTGKKKEKKKADVSIQTCINGTQRDRSLLDQLAVTTPHAILENHILMRNREQAFIPHTQIQER